jgi:hypothetical protein
MRTRSFKLLLASLCLMLLPAAALADGVILGPCGNANLVGNANVILGPCPLAGGGSALYGGQAISGVNSFLNNHSPVLAAGGVGQVNVFTQQIISTPVWTVPGPVLTGLTLNGVVNILEPGASVDITFTGLLGGAPLVIQGHFVNSVNVGITIFGMQAIAPAAVSTLTITINGAATFFAPGSGEFAGGVPEPASLLLLGSGLTGVALKLRRKRKVSKNQAG